MGRKATEKDMGLNNFLDWVKRVYNFYINKEFPNG